MRTTAPIVSVGIIFRNHKRCLERCLKSLEPLRQEVPCEVVMADTGSDDGSREIAGKYADLIIDFPWIDDFSAARNAVMDRCTGSWHLTIDCDEWLDEDISELAKFLKNDKTNLYAFVIQRNYFSPELEKSEFRNDFHALRLARLMPQIRYHGLIHESWPFQEPCARLMRTVFHHDGYMLTTTAARKEKGRRNMALLRKILEENPENLRTLLQCIESGRSDVDYPQFVRRAVTCVLEKKPEWKRYGPAILRHAVDAAREREMPEYEEWLDYAQKHFADSLFTKIDLQYTAFMAAHDREDWKGAARHAKTYLKTMQAVRGGKIDTSERGTSSLTSDNSIVERNVRIGLANAYFQNKKFEASLKALAELEGENLDGMQIRNTIILLLQFQAQTTLDTAPLMSRLYAELSAEGGDPKKKEARLAAFESIASMAFTKGYQKEEQKHDGYWRPAYTLFLPLQQQCETGRGAAILTAEDAGQIKTQLLAVEDWAALPIAALEHALAHNVAFPLPEKPLAVEVLDGLAMRMTHEENMAKQLVLTLTLAEDAGEQSVHWAQSLLFAVLGTYDWKMEKDDSQDKEKDSAADGKKKTGFDVQVPNVDIASGKVEQAGDAAKEEDKPQTHTPEEGAELLRRFAELEALILPRTYTPEALSEENAPLLPPMHRWGLYCALAVEALDAGDPHEYLAMLRKGVRLCPGEKGMVQFLLDRFLKDSKPLASPELVALAERVRGMLATYRPDDPAVAAIKESPAYRQVAWMIEAAPVGQPVQ